MKFSERSKLAKQSKETLTEHFATLDYVAPLNDPGQVAENSHVRFDQTSCQMLSYLASFEKEERQKNAALLTNF